MKKIIPDLSVSVLIAFSIFVWGCGQSQQTNSRSASDHGHDHGPGSDHDHNHKSFAANSNNKQATPHGGTPVQVGDHGYHLELVNDPVDGKMLAYVLDAHLEKAVNVPPTSFEMIAKTDKQEHRLTFSAVTNAPNASVAETSVFAAPATGLSQVSRFDGVIPKITLNGKSFENVTFSYPEGTRHSH